MDISALAERLARLEDIQAIERLKYTYCLHCDRGYDADALAALFVEDAVWDGGPKRGRIVGREAIRNFFAGISQRMTYAAHLLANPIIDLQGDTATGRWRMLQPHMARDPEGNERSRWQLGAYVDGFVRVDGRWMIKTLSVELALLDEPAGRWVVFQ